MKEYSEYRWYKMIASTLKDEFFEWTLHGFTVSPRSRLSRGGVARLGLPRDLTRVMQLRRSKMQQNVA